MIEALKTRRSVVGSSTSGVLVLEDFRATRYGFGRSIAIVVVVEHSTFGVSDLEDSMLGMLVLGRVPAT